MSALATDITVFRVDLRTGTVERKEDSVATEAPLHVFFDRIHLVSILSSPTMLKELVMGHLLGEGLIRSVNEVVDVEFTEGNKCVLSLRDIDAEDRVIVSRPFARLILSACGTLGYKSLSELLESLQLKPVPSWQVKAKTLLDCMKRLNTSTDTFRITGGVHVAGLFQQQGALVMLAEDVGRHNAVDKVVGAAALRGDHLGKCFLGLSGRLTADIVLKAARVGIPIVASLAAAVDSGVVVAKKAKMTLVGFARGQRMNIYTCPERIAV
jgi:FdhD protein